jgi:hypothetical protein
VQISSAPTSAQLASYDTDQDTSIFLDDGKDKTTRAGIRPGNKQLWPPPCYVHVVPLRNGDRSYTGLIDIQYWFFYPLNGALTLNWSINPFQEVTAGEHVGDWEYVAVRVQYFQTIVEVYCSAHDGGKGYSDDVTYAKGTDHPVVFAARHSHANYIDRGTLGTHWRWAADDYTSKGVQWQTWNNLVRVEWSILPTVNGQDWIRYTGRWGQTPKKSKIIPDSPTGPATRDEFLHVVDGDLFAEVANPGTAYVIFGGACFRIPPKSTYVDPLIDLGFVWRNVAPVPNGFVAAFPTGLGDNTIVREGQTRLNPGGKVYVFAGGAKFLISPDQQAFSNMNNCQAIPPYLMGCMRRRSRTLSWAMARPSPWSYSS